MRATAALLLLLAACSGDPTAPEGAPRELAPVPNPFGPGDPLYSEQPHRDRPTTIVASADESLLYVALAGTETEPGRAVAVVDAESLQTVRRIPVGPGPSGLALHPNGRFLVVTNRFASYASVVDTHTQRVVSEIDVPYYTEHVAFSPEGRRVYFANRWKDAVLFGDVTGGLSALALSRGCELPNPGRLVVTPDGARVLVTSESSLEIVACDAMTGETLGRYSPGAPVIDATIVEGFVYVLHTGSGTNHPPDRGLDGDGDGEPGDGTANVGFQDLQNEIDVLSLEDLSRLHRYTSDTICCRDYRDVNPDRPMSGAELAPVDAWPASRAAFLPPRTSWIVAGSMPERVIPFHRSRASEPALAVVYGGSSEIQTFDVRADGSLLPRETAETGLFRTGHGAKDGAWLARAGRLVVVERLGETLSSFDLDAGVRTAALREVVGDVTGGPFPSTDAELGEAFNTMTARFGIDGDQTCVHCHRDGSPVGKAVSMPLLTQPEWGVRLVMSYRSAYDSRPWFLEAAMDESNFFPVINEFARKENFCCEQTDPRVWSRYPSHGDCSADSTLPGCNHVLDCLDDPPPECAERPYGSEHLTRDAHFRAAALDVLGRDESFGDALYSERVTSDGTIERRPIKLGFDGITRALGLFLLSQSRELPNPNAAVASSEARLGEAIYHSSEAGCASCHPLPIGSTAHGTVVTQETGPLRFPYVVSNVTAGELGDVDRVNPAFLGTFPDAVQTSAGLRVGVTSLRGAWDRTRFLHHGRARSLIEVLATPGHPALRGDERGLNERDGQPNTHGGTSHLSADELRALEAFVETL